jgi:hypothetical protein
VTPDHFPRDQFYCLLDDQPEYLIPPRLIQPREGTGPLIVNPLCWFAWQHAAPADMARRIGPTTGLFETPWTVWVDDPAIRAVTPFCLGPGLAHVLVDMIPGQPLKERPPDRILAILWNAEIVVTPDHAARRRHQWLQASRYYASYLPRGFVVMDNLVHPFILAALRRYFRHQTRCGRFRLGDHQSNRRYIAYDEPVATFFHRQLTHAVSDVADAILDPSYNYTALYQGGASLPIHTDRAACEFTLSVAIDATPEPEAQVPWPLYLQAPEGTITVWQYLGDGLLFRGRQIPHWRERLPDEETASSILLHYVHHGGQSQEG